MSEIVASNSGLPISASQMDWATLEANALAIVDQGQLERDKHLFNGIPFVITKVSYRIPASGPDGTPQRGYVSLEGRTGPTHLFDEQISRGRLGENVHDIDDLVVQPNESFVMNDGSTGIRRQVTMYLHSGRLLDIGERSENGDDADFDRPWTEWASFSQVGFEKDDQGNKVEIPEFTHRGDGVPLSIVVKHGLRPSEYDAFGQKATTFYLS